MNTKLFVLLIAATSLVGCRRENDPETRAINQVNANAPEFVANTPKGKLYRIIIDIGAGRHEDRIYYFENSNEVNINKTIQSGKTSRTETSVIIDGKEYILKQ
jgi:hypothetical protein